MKRPFDAYDNISFRRIIKLTQLDSREGLVDSDQSSLAWKDYRRRGGFSGDTAGNGVGG